MDPAEHDRVFAWVSHLPHLAAFALVEALTGGREGWLAWSGAGLRDTTRIAASSPRMWSEIALANRAELSQALARYRGGLDEIARLLERGDAVALEAMFARAAAARRRVP
jgi:prephenate dehydrogenase